MRINSTSQQCYLPLLTDHVSNNAALITNKPPIIVIKFTLSLSNKNANILPYKGCKQEISPAVVADKLRNAEANKA